MKPNPALLLSSTILLSSCIILPVPHDRAISPVFFGQVKDKETGLPVKNATISVSAHLLSLSKDTTVPTVSTTTDENGFYRAGVTKHENWFVLFVGPAEGTCGGTVTVAHNDYEQFSYEVSQFRGAAVNGMCTGFEIERNVSLKKK